MQIAPLSENSELGLVISTSIHPISYKEVYLNLLNGNQNNSLEAISFLEAQLSSLNNQPNYLPEDITEVKNWMLQNSSAVGEKYQEYLTHRKNGAPRQYFRSKSHALFFIKSVAPTKMVDGSWLYGFLKYWQDDRFLALIKIYLEELGNGNNETNHVVLYRKLLNTYGIEDWLDLEDKNFQQGAIQLALGNSVEDFLPEAIGFNLGYEQLPLHLLITAYELNELLIDSSYFTLHVTIDNAVTGHANAAVKAIYENMPAMGDEEEYFRRVRRGYQLNDLGLSATDIINSYDIDQEFLSILAKKSVVGKKMHNHQCVIDGLTINEWLASNRIAEFVQTMEKYTWIKRHQDPRNSHFWKMIGTNKASMFGVFTPYEKQVIYDWIAGDSIEEWVSTKLGTSLDKPSKSFASSYNPQVWEKELSPRGNLGVSKSNIFPMKFNNEVKEGRKIESNDFNQEDTIFQKEIINISSKNDLMHFLITWLSPAKHHTHIGLKATQNFHQEFWN